MAKTKRLIHRHDPNTKTCSHFKISRFKFTVEKKCTPHSKCMAVNGKYSYVCVCVCECRNGGKPSQKQAQSNSDKQCKKAY